MENTKSGLGKIMTHKWTPKKWTVGTGAEKHMISFDLHLETFFGQSSVRVPGYSVMKAEVVQLGPAYVSLKINLGYLFQGYFIQTIHPEEQFMQRVTHRLIARPSNQLLLTKIYLQSERFQFERDVSMWNHKIYQSNPVLVKDDGPIRKYRNWYQQFYSTASNEETSKEPAETNNGVNGGIHQSTAANGSVKHLSVAADITNPDSAFGSELSKTSENGQDAIEKNGIRQRNPNAVSDGTTVDNNLKENRLSNGSLPRKPLSTNAKDLEW